ncbi:arylformamidase [Fredinandcohnia sp. 179-A 10B2 NHS]|uniref:arylformamidase n=1 Tax=Fredinandcohnia sp. 179-A 10B2 NHS TaxID=3235176 RepID=UPI00399F5121
MTLIDISQQLRQGIPEWPGDTPYELEMNWSIAKGSSVNVGKVTTSTHIGTHVDAPFHFDNKGKKIHELDLSLYVGKAKVIKVSECDEIGVGELKGFDLEGVKRLLICTQSWKDKGEFPKSIPYLQPEVAPYLAEKGIKLIGVDVPSVDPLDSKELKAHHNLHKYRIHILEGIVLEHVEPGDYELIALPLPIVDGDGSPVRAVLRNI